MLQRLGIRGKILAVVAVPILVLLLAAGYITLAAVNALNDATNAQQLVETDKSAKPFQTAFNAERDAAANFVDTYTSYNSARQAQEVPIDTAMDALQLASPSAWEKVNDIFAGGNGDATMSLTAARLVAPSVPKNGTEVTWPAQQSSDDAVATLFAMSDQVDALADKAKGDAADLLGDIAFDLNTEATAAQNLFTVPQPYEAAYEAAVADSDQTWAALLSDMNSVPSNANNDAVVAMITTVKDQMRDLEETRATVATVGNSANNLSQWYGGVLDSVNDMIDRSSIAVDDPDLSLQLSAYGAMFNLMQELSLESTQTQRILRQGDYGQGDATAARNQVAATDFALDQAQIATAAVSSELLVPDWGASRVSGSNYDFASIRNTVANGDAAALATIATQDWVGMVDAEEAAQEPAFEQSIAMATSRADTLRQEALVQAAITAVGAIVAIALSLIVALLIARRIVVPLRRLTTTATAVRAELPRLVERVAMPGETVDVAEVQIPVESRDEVGRLAEAFNGVNAATLSIAAEQAALRGSISEMFVNVARRDQVLLNRQLASIDDMERTQDDPETLTKLFALDHLATRMRRNSESLLVLAGIDTGRRLRRSMPLSDVIRTASSEIELYERVQLELDADPAMLGHSALTAAHLFAELLENATVFSDPGTPVIVRTSEQDGLYVVEVQDSGIGMTETELAEANSRVASTAASEILGAQRLGLFVVGRIARRIGARVSIESAEGQGTTARVVMTRSLFDSTVAPDVVHHTESTVDEAMHAPAALVANSAEDEQFEAPAAPSEAPAAAAAAAVAAYQPAVVESAPLVSREAPAEVSVDDLIAADAEAAPAGVAVDSADLTDGVTGMGLPTRRRRNAPVEVSEDEEKKIIGLPARATAAQLSALEAATPDEAFKPAIPASELSPQTPEERAQMFRGFRSRRELTENAPEVDPEAESLGHAARRGGLAPEDLVAAAQVEEPVEQMVIPSLEEDEHDHAAAAAAAVAGVAAVSALDVPALAADGDEDVADAPMVVPMLEDDDEFPVAQQAAEPVAQLDDAVAEVQVEDDAPAQQLAEPAEVAEVAEPAAEPEPEFVGFAAQPEPQPEPQPVVPPAAPVVAAAAAAAPFSYADVYGSLPSPSPAPEPPQAWAAEPAPVPAAHASAEPTLDELIAGSTDEEAVKSGFFSRLFGRSKKDKKVAAAAATAAVVANAADDNPPSGGLEFGNEPTDGGFGGGPRVVPEPAFAGAPAYEASAGYAEAPVQAAAPVYDSAPAYEAAPAYDAPAVVEAPPVAAPVAEAAPVEQAAPAAPGGAFALWTSQPAQEAPAAPAAPEAAVVEAPAPATFEVPTAGQAFSVDELANPFGWEAAGATALAAAEPEATVEYQPVVDIQPELDSEVSGQAEMTSAVFSELSSLAAERPKVETTRAGLQRRRAADAPAVEVKPIEAEVQLSHKERDADEVRSRFSSFYSGTQRARHDVAEFEQRSQSTAGKE